MLQWNYVISLERRDDRWNELQERISKTCLKEEKFVRFKAFDASNFDKELERFNMKDDFIVKTCSQKRLKVPKGLFGCYISHLKVLEEIVNNSDIKEEDYVGIYEDDFFPCDDIKKFNEGYQYLKTLQKSLNAMGVDLLYHGGRFYSDFIVPIQQFYLNYNFTNIDRIYDRKNLDIYYKTKDMNVNVYYIDRTCNAYIVKKGICKKIIKLLNILFLQKIDNIIEFDAVDAVFNRGLYKNINVYEFFPHIFYSPGFYKSDIQGEENQQNILDFSQI